MVYFTEKLINEVRKRSCIWDATDMNHLNKEVLTSTWTEIAENLHSDWHTLSGFDKRGRGKQIIYNIISLYFVLDLYYCIHLI
jgi:hypothetical protein